MTEQEFRNTYPPEIIELMLIKQQEQGNPKNIQPFLHNIYKGSSEGAFNWRATIEGYIFWNWVLVNLKFDVFYEKYPKKKNSKILL